MSACNLVVPVSFNPIKSQSAAPAAQTAPVYNYAEQFEYNTHVPMTSYYNGTAVDNSGAVYAVGLQTDPAGVSSWIVRRFVSGVWTTIDIYRLAVGFTSTANAVTADNSGNIFVVGMAGDSANSSHWIVRKYATGSGVWTTIDDNTAVPTTNGSTPNAIVVSNTGEIYVAGSVVTNQTTYAQAAVVRKFSAGSWTNIDNYQYTAGQTSQYQAITLDAGGNPYVAGYAGDGTNSYWIVRSFISGSWTLSDTTFTGGQYYQIRALGKDGSGTIYAAGNELDSSYVSHWIVRKFQAGSWSTIDDYSDSVHYTTNQPFAMAFDTAGSIYVSGSLNDSAGYHWIVRKYASGTWSNIDNFPAPASAQIFANGISVDSSNHVYVVGQEYTVLNGVAGALVRAFDGTSWSQSDLYQYYSAVSVANAVTTDPNGVLYSAGYGVDSSSINHWLVRKFVNGAWTTIDDYQFIAGQSSQANRIKFNSAGDLFVLGTANASPFPHWQVRKLSNGVWTTTEDYVPGFLLGVTDLYVDSAGAVYTCGYYLDNSTIQFHWIVRKFASGSWTAIDDYQYNSSDTFKQYFPSSIQSDGLGNLYVSGYVNDSTSNSHWIVRKLSSGSWTLIDDFQDAGSYPTAAVSSTFDTAGNLYVAGTSYNAGTSKEIVRKYSGGSWTTSDSYLNPVNSAMYVSTLLALPGGDLYTTISVSDTVGSATNHWLSRKFHMGSWSNVDDFTVTGNRVTSLGSSVYVPTLNKVVSAGLAISPIGAKDWVTHAVTP